MTAPSVQLVPADQTTITALFQLYLYDITASTGWPVGKDGTYAYPTDLLPPYWDHPQTHAPSLITADGEIAGFCLVRRDPIDATRWDMGQFFVLQKFRRSGVGRRAFQTALQQHPGKWQVRVLVSNAAAHTFWSKSITTITGRPAQSTQGMYHSHEMTFLRFLST